MINESQLKLVVKKALNESLLLKESKATETLSLNIMKKRDIKNPEEVLQKLKGIDQSQNQVLLPIMSFLYTEMDLSEVFGQMVELINTKNLKMPTLTNNKVKFINPLITDEGKDPNVYFDPSDPLKFEEFIHGVYVRKMGSSSSLEGENDVQVVSPSSDELLFNENGIEIYDGRDAGRCIRYRHGELTGKVYGFCIGARGIDNRYHDYRQKYSSTFYFVVDRNRKLDDNLHIVVVDHQKHGFQLTDAINHSGDIAEYGGDVEGYFDYLRTKGVPVEEIFKQEPLTAEEIEIERRIGKANHSLDYFDKLTPKLKGLYLLRGHELTDEQFDYLWEDRKSKFFDELLMKYFSTGRPLNKYQFDKMIEG